MNAYDGPEKSYEELERKLMKSGHVLRPMPINYFLDEFMPEVTASWEDMDNCFKGFDASWGEQRRAQSVVRVSVAFFNITIH